MTSKSVLIVLVALLLVVEQGASQTMDASALSSAYAAAADKCKKSVVSINVGLSKVTRKRLKHFEEYVNRSGGSISPGCERNSRVRVLTTQPYA